MATKTRPNYRNHEINDIVSIETRKLGFRYYVREAGSIWAEEVCPKFRTIKAAKEEIRDRA